MKPYLDEALGVMLYGLIGLAAAFLISLLVGVIGGLL